MLFSAVAAPIYIPTNSVQDFQVYSTSLPTFVIYGLFDDSCSDRYEVISRCGFDLHFMSLPFLISACSMCQGSVCTVHWPLCEGLCPQQGIIGGRGL